MAIKSKSEILDSIKEHFADDTSDSTLSFLEDVSDTMNDFESRASDTTNWKTKYEENDKEWRNKYKERFFNAPANETEHDGPEPTKKLMTYEDLFK